MKTLLIVLVVMMNTNAFGGELINSLTGERVEMNRSQDKERVEFDYYLENGEFSYSATAADLVAMKKNVVKYYKTERFKLSKRAIYYVGHVALPFVGVVDLVKIPGLKRQEKNDFKILDSLIYEDERVLVKEKDFKRIIKLLPKGY